MNFTSTTRLLSIEPETKLEQALADRLKEAVTYLRICSEHIKEITDNEYVYGKTNEVSLDKIDTFTGDYKTLCALYWDFVVKIGQMEVGAAVLISQENINLSREIHDGDLSEALRVASIIDNHLRSQAVKGSGIEEIIRRLS